MLKSMTAYASAEQTEDDLTACVEIRSFNSRYLDVVLRLPPSYVALENKIRSRIAAKLVRGRVEVSIKIKDASDQVCLFEADLVKARAFYDAANELQQHLKMKVPLSLDQLVSVPGIIQTAENAKIAEAHWPLLIKCLNQALGDLDQMRLKEGAFIGQDFIKRLDDMEKGLDLIEKATKDIVIQCCEKLQTRIETLTQGMVDLDPARITQEAALLADRSDISEEIVRIRSHIEQFQTIMQDNQPSGRKLNFLLQEFNREFNTMGAKVGQAKVSHIIVELKAEIEKLREQVQNIE